MKSLLRAVAPALVVRFRTYREECRLWREARELAGDLARRRSIDERVDAARSYPRVVSTQKPPEIAALLRLLAGQPPQTVCEIGAFKGGTLALLASEADSRARILSIDLDYPAIRRKVNRLLCGPAQELTCLEADSHAAATRRRVEDWLRGTRFDLLFIDGDHTYDGVKRDHEMYGPLVRPGGLIVFHDIVEDARTRFGTPSDSDVGDVPKYWAEVKASMRDTIELVEDPMQDGYGIGIIRV